MRREVLAAGLAAKAAYAGTITSAQAAGEAWPANVEGIGVSATATLDAPVVILYARERPTRRAIARMISIHRSTGARFEVHVAGGFLAGSLFPPRPILRGADLSPRARHRPVPGGVSIGGEHVTAGTAGIWLPDPTTRSWMLLTNKHVVGADVTTACTGRRVLQPGPYDGGRRIDDAVARVAREHVLDPGQVHRVDGALCEAMAEGLVARRLLGLASPDGVIEAEPGMACEKAGRTTGVTRGRVVSVSTDLTVGYSRGLRIRFTDQIVVQSPAGHFSAGGDSGSAVLAGPRLMGLLFAGSGSGHTIVNPIRRVVEELQLAPASRWRIA